jgi:hypothetical protein
VRLKALISVLSICALALSGAACGAPKSEEAPKKAAAPAAPKPTDQTRRFPMAERVDVTLTEDPLFGKAFLPGGNLAQYKRGAREYEMFLIRAASPGAAATLLFDYKNTLADAKFVAHFGGYFGDDAGTPTFLFSKGSWLAGVRGLNREEADAVARELAARIDAD